MSWIQTFTKKRFEVYDPSPEALDIRDIARALSHQCRYVGHVDRFYSVAEHSVRVSRRVEHLLVWEKYLEPTDKAVLEPTRWALIHDASEAYLGDVARPIKMLESMAPYRAAEARLMACITGWLGLQPDEPTIVKEVDSDILGTEVAQLKSPAHPDWGATTPTGVLPKAWEGHFVYGWKPQDAERVFLERFRRLFGTVSNFTRGMT